VAKPIFPSFRNVQVLVTGATGGLGRCFAEHFAAEGAQLILTARSREKLQRLASELPNPCGVPPMIFDCDLSDPDSAGRLHDAVQKSGRAVDILVNNAGLGWCGHFEEVSWGRLREMTEVNILSLVRLTRFFVPSMLTRGRGGILNVASTAAFQPMPFLSLYAASKAFVLSFTEALWGEYQGRGLRILAVCPGHTRTDFHREAGFRPEEIFFLATPERVVRKTLRVFRTSNKPSVIDGFRNAWLAMGYRILPRRWLIAVTKMILNRKDKR
jgi:short-subunit dehydrogenase